MYTATQPQPQTQNTTEMYKTHHPKLAIVRFLIRQRLFHARRPPLVVIAPRALPLKLRILNVQTDKTMF